MNTTPTLVPHQAGIAFDSLAEQYDDIFTNSLVGRAQRQVVWEATSRTFRRGDHILELNCGTGEDALFLARLGISVFACDASEKMISVAARRREMEAPRAPVRFEALPIERIADARIFGPFDGIFSNFSGLNCVAGIGEAARQLATLVTPGAPALLCVSTRVCLWETLWFLTRGKTSMAFRRWNGRTTASLGRFAVEVQYPTVRTLRKLFAPHFVLRSWTGIGVAVPPSYLEHLARRHQRGFRRLRAIDSVISGWPVFRGIGDHVLLTFERSRIMTTTASPIIASQRLAEPIDGLRLQCPQCRGTLDRVRQANAGAEFPLRCSGCLFLLRWDDGIGKALPPVPGSFLRALYSANIRSYAQAEGRGSDASEYYLALPDRDLSGHNVAQWAIRARTFHYIEGKILPPIEVAHRAGLKVLDLGAGNGWLSYRLALRGHQPVAVDLLTNDQDGLGAAVHFRQTLPALFPRFQAELDHLPFASGQFDLAIFNASFHYSENYERTLAETLRCLRPGGAVIIADTAWYSRDESGRQMLSERRKAFTAQYGFASDAVPSLEYLTDERLAALEQRLGLRWQVHTPFYGLRWAMRPWVARLRGRREPSRFRIYVAEAGNDHSVQSALDQASQSAPSPLRSRACRCA